MNYLTDIKKILLDSNEMLETKNYFFETHLCDVKSQEIKVNLEYTLKVNENDEIVNFGACKHCKKIYYHKDYYNKRS